MASECLFVGGGCRVGELCHDLGEYGSISCPFNAQSFVIHGFSFTLNRITWLLCQDSGLGTLIWESPWHWRHGLIYNAKNYTSTSFVCLETLSMNANSRGKALGSRKLWSVVCKSVFFFWIIQKRSTNLILICIPQSFCVGSSKSMLRLFELIFNIGFYFFTLIIGLPIYWLITKYTSCSREKAVSISVSQPSLQKCYKFPSIPLEIHIHFVCSLFTDLNALKYICKEFLFCQTSRYSNRSWLICQELLFFI